MVSAPAAMRLVKNDPSYNESWPRAVVPYRRIYGLDEPRTLPRLANDGSLSKHLPEGTPLGPVGTSSFYKRESYPSGAVPPGRVTATYAGGSDPWRGLDAFTSHGNGMPLNWHNQGGDAGLYSNDDVHAVRILAMEPTTDRYRGANAGRRFHSHATERLRILGEIPLRKFAATVARSASERDRGEEPSLARRATVNEPAQPLDPDGNPDTSFLAKIPADTAFTFQTLDRRGVVLNMAQTWHQLRPGEVRTNCGGCHAHSQQPTDFARTAAARPDYAVWDLLNTTPLVVDKSRDESKRQWDARDETGLRILAQSVANVEYFRDVQPILRKCCVACHTAKHGLQPAGNLNLDADDDRRTIVRWIDLGCPIDLDYDPQQRDRPGFGWMLDDNRPVVTITLPRPGANTDLTRILLGMHDYGSGLDPTSWSVAADFPIDDTPAGSNLAARFQPRSQGVWEMRLGNPITALPRGQLTVATKDRQGNRTRIDREFSVPRGDTPRRHRDWSFNRDPTGRAAVNRDPTGRAAANRDPTGRAAANRDPTGRAAAGCAVRLMRDPLGRGQTRQPMIIDEAYHYSLPRRLPSNPGLSYALDLERTCDQRTSRADSIQSG